MGADQVLPPSVDMEKAMLLYWPPEKRESSQTTYRLPLCGPTATSVLPLGRPSPEPNASVATGLPVTGLITRLGCILKARIGLPVGSHVWPWSVDCNSDTLGSTLVPPSLFLVRSVSVKTSTRAPSGRATIWLTPAIAFAPGL